VFFPSPYFLLPAPSLRRLLALLPAYDLVGIAYALSEVWLRLLFGANLGGELADELAVDARDRDVVLLGCDLEAGRIGILTGCEKPRAMARVVPFTSAL